MMTYISKGLQEEYGCAVCGKIPAYLFEGVREPDGSRPFPVVLCPEHARIYVRTTSHSLT